MSRSGDVIPPEALLADYPPTTVALANGLRKLVLATVPGSVERVRAGWRIIGFDLPVGRRLVYFAWVMPERVHVHLGFPWGVMLHDPDGLLGGVGETKRARWFTLERPEHLDDPRLVEFTRMAADLGRLGRR